MRPRAIPGGAALTAAAMLAAVLVSTRALAAAPIRVSALVAQNAAPYQRALAGFKRAWDGPVSSHILEFEDDALARVKAEQPALVLAVGVKAAKLALQLGVPVVYCMVLDPKANGMDAPQAVGVPLEIPPQVQLEQLKRLLPNARSVGLVFNPARFAREVEEAQAAGERLSLAVMAEPATGAAQFPEALKKLVPRAQALWLLADPTVVTQDTFRLMLESAMANHLPLLVFSDDFVRRGALMALTPDFEGAGAEAARLARSIAEGKKVGELPPAQPRWTLVVNLTTAKALGISFSPDTLKGAVAVQ
jgi:putative tryptophan/tyrosine transport system substrate-binding protein